MTIPMCQLTTLPMHSDSHPDCRRVLTLIDALQLKLQHRLERHDDLLVARRGTVHSNL